MVVSELDAGGDMYIAVIVMTMASSSGIVGEGRVVQIDFQEVSHKFVSKRVFRRHTGVQIGEEAFFPIGRHVSCSRIIPVFSKRTLVHGLIAKPPSS